MVAPLGLLKDTPESNNPTKFEADRPSGCEVTANRVFLKGPSKATSFSLLDLETGTFKRNSSQSLRDRVMIFRQIDLVDSCFSFFGFEITASTLMAKTSSLSRVPLPREMPLTTLMLWRTFLLSQIMAMHLNLPAKEPWARSNCLP